MRRLHSILVVACCGMLAMPALSQDRPPVRPPDAPPRPVRPAQGQDAAPNRAMMANISTVNDVAYATVQLEDGSSHELLMDTYFPRDATEPLPAVIFVHGGGFTGGNKEQGRLTSVQFANGGYFAASVNYRLAQQGQFPAAVHDVKAAVRFLRANAAELNIDPDKIAIYGVSAGGYLATMVGVSPGHNVMEGLVGTMGASSSVAAVVSIAGPVDFIEIVSANRQIARWFGGNREDITRNAEAANPTQYVRSSVPPMLLIHGDNDEVVPVAHSRTLHQAIEAAGGKSELLIVPDAGHNIRNPRAMLRVAQFFDEHLGGKAAEAIMPRGMPRDGDPGARPGQRGGDGVGAPGRPGQRGGQGGGQGGQGRGGQGGGGGGGQGGGN